MKSSFLTILIYVGLFITAHGQSLTQGFSMDEDIIGAYYKPDQNHLDYLDNLRSLSERQMKWEVIKSDGYWTKANGKPKLLKGFVFKIDGRTLYGDCKIINKVVGTKIIKPESDIRYKSNDQLFCSGEDITKGKINKNATLYNEDGSILYQEKTVADGRLIELTSYKSKNELAFKYQTDGSGFKVVEQTAKGPVRNGYLYDWVYRNEKVISPFAQETAIISLADSSRYVGFSHVGTLHTQEHGDFTGYFFPHQLRTGNGSVFYRTIDGKNEWVLVIDGEIEMVVSATAEEAPDLPQLMNSLSNMIILNTAPLLPDGIAKNIGRMPHVGKYQTIDIKNHNGYGINYFTEDSLMAGDKRFLEVGIFKNGQLNGIGYRCKMTSIYDPHQNSVPKNEKLAFGEVQEKVFAEAGLFEAGQLKEGRVIEINNDNGKNRNYWTKDKISSLDYVRRKNWLFKRYNVVQSVSLSEIPQGSEIYIERMDATCQLQSIDVVNKTITVKWGEESVKLDKDCGPIYQFMITQGEVPFDCPKTRAVKNYEWYDKTVSHKITAYDTRTVSGVDGKIIYSRKLKNASLDITYKAKRMNGYKTVACWVCNGSGKKYAKQKTELFKPISFD